MHLQLTPIAFYAAFKEIVNSCICISPQDHDVQVPKEPAEEAQMQSKVQQKPAQQTRQSRGKGKAVKAAQRPKEDKRKGKKRKSM